MVKSKTKSDLENSIMHHNSDVNYLEKRQWRKKLHTSSHYFLDHPRIIELLLC